MRSAKRALDLSKSLSQKMCSKVTLVHESQIEEART
jgi:hypothetical protein